MSSANEIALNDIEILDEDLSFGEIEDTLKAELDASFEDLSSLEADIETIENPDSLAKVVADEVLHQFGNQIGLDLTKETLIQKYDREHPEPYSKEIGDEIKKQSEFWDTRGYYKEMQQNGELIDAYTGKLLKINEQFDLDHVVSRKEIYENKRRKQASIDTKDLANKTENLKPTNSSLNRSMQDKSIKEYLSRRTQREKDLKVQYEKAVKKIENDSNIPDTLKREIIDKRKRELNNKLAADDGLMRAADKEARKAINKDIYIGATNQTAVKAGKDALKMVAITALFDLLRNILNGLVQFFKEKQKSFKLFLIKIKESILDFIHNISNLFRTGVSSFVGTVVSEIFGPIVSMFKKLASFIKQGVSTLIEAIHYILDKENKDKPLSIKIAQVAKIVTAGLAATGAIVGGELIEKALLQIPIMATPIPALGTIANITGLFLSSLLSGIVGAIVMNRIDSYIAGKLRNDNLLMQIDKKNMLLTTQNKYTKTKINNLVETKEQCAKSISERRRQAMESISNSLSTIFNENDDNNDVETDDSKELVEISLKLDGLLK